MQFRSSRGLSMPCHVPVPEVCVLTLSLAAARPTVEDTHVSGRAAGFIPAVVTVNAGIQGCVSPPGKRANPPLLFTTRLRLGRVLPSVAKTVLK